MSMKKTDYSCEDMVRALREVGLREGDVVFSHSNIGFFGRPEANGTTRDACATIIEAFRTVLGAEGTLTVPTFTYSFCKG